MRESRTRFINSSLRQSRAGSTGYKLFVTSTVEKLISKAEGFSKSSINQTIQSLPSMAHPNNRNQQPNGSKVYQILANLWQITYSVSLDEITVFKAFRTKKMTSRQGLSQTQINNMSPLDVVEYWALGDGGKIYFGPDSKVSKQFSRGDGAKLLEDLFYKKFGGNPPDLGRMDHVDYKYTWVFPPRAFNTNLSVQMVGTWKGHAVRAGNQVLFRANNSMTFSSLTFGRQRSEAGVGWLNPKAFGPKKNDLFMTVEWVRPRK